MESLENNKERCISFNVKINVKHAGVIDEDVKEVRNVVDSWR